MHHPCYSAFTFEIKGYKMNNEQNTTQQNQQGQDPLDLATQQPQQSVQNVPTVGTLPEPPAKSQQLEEKKEAPKKVFTRNDVKRFIEAPLVFPAIYPGYEPFVFRMRLKLSREAEERRQQYLSLSAAEVTARTSEQALDEVCDLLTELPTGFGDLRDTGQGPGPSFRSYYETTTDPDVKEFLRLVVEGADSFYWGAVAPREFRG